MFKFVFRESHRGCSLGELVGSRVLFLREQVRELWVQEFLRELVVGVAAPSDLARLILVKILHCGEGGDVEQVAQTSKQFSRVCDCSTLSHCVLYLHAYIVSYLYMLDIYLCFIDILAWNCLVFCMLSFLVHLLHACVCAYTSIQPRKL